MRTLALITCVVAVVGCGDDTGGAGGGGGSTGADGAGGGDASGTTASTASGSSAANAAADEHACTELCACNAFPTVSDDCQGTCEASYADQRSQYAGHPCEAEYDVYTNCVGLAASCVGGQFSQDVQACQAENEAVGACVDAQQAGSTGAG